MPNELERSVWRELLRDTRLAEGREDITKSELLATMTGQGWTRDEAQDLVTHTDKVIAVGSDPTDPVIKLRQKDEDTPDAEEEEEVDKADNALPIPEEEYGDPQPQEFAKFHSHLMENAPEGYKPWYFRVREGSKAPATRFGSWKKENARLDPEDAIDWMREGGNVGIAGTPDDPLVNVDVDDDEKTTKDDIKPTLIARSRSRTGWHAWYFERQGEDAETIPNIPTDDAGEIRTDWQYVVAPGSYVETDPADVPEGHRDLAGYYTVEEGHDVARADMTEMPDVFHRALREREEQQQKIEERDNDLDDVDIDIDTNGQSALYDVDASEIVRREGGGSLNESDRWTALWHGSDTDANMSYSDKDLIHCWRHNVTHNALQALAVLGGFGGCQSVGAGKSRSGAGASSFSGNDEALWTAWRYAKDHGYIPSGDRVPTRALDYIARSETDWGGEYTERESDGESFDAIPSTYYNAALDVIEDEYGLDAGRERLDEPEPHKAPALEDEGENDDEEEAVESDTDESDDANVEREDRELIDSPKTALAKWISAQKKSEDGTPDRSEIEYKAQRLLLDYDDFATHPEKDDDHDIYRYDAEEGIYVQDGNNYIHEVLVDALGVEYSQSIYNEVAGRIRAKTRTPIDEWGAETEEFPVGNGILDIDEWVDGDREEALRDYSSDDNIIHKADVEYDPDAEMSQFETFLGMSVRSGGDRKKLQEYIGYTIGEIGAMPYHKALFLAGPPASGKSTFIDIVSSALFPEARIGAQNPQDMIQQYRRIGLRDNWLNVAGDIPSSAIEDVGSFKTLVGDDKIEAEIKYQQQRPRFYPSCKHIFSANQLPTPGTLDRAFWRRVLIVAFPESVPKEAREKNLSQKIAEEDASAILNWALEGYERLMENDGFTADRNIEKTRETWHTWSTSVFRFAARATRRDMGSSESVNDVYSAYQDFVKDEMEDDVIADSQASFTRKLTRLRHIDVADGGERQYENIRLRSDYAQSEDNRGGSRSSGADNLSSRNGEASWSN